MAAKLGDFFVNIDTKADSKGIKEVETGLDGLIGQAKKLAVAYLSFKTAKALVNADVAIVKDAAELSRLSQDLGVATDELEGFGRAFEVVGSSADEAYSTIRTLTKAMQAIPMGDEGAAEAFGILGLGPQNFGTDAIKNFDAIRKRFNQLNSAQQLYFSGTIGLGEKSLRVLRLNDEEYQNLLDTVKEAPRQTFEQSKKAERFARMNARAKYSADAGLRSAAIETEPALTKAADLIRIGGIDGAEFINAHFIQTDGKGEKAKRKQSRSEHSLSQNKQIEQLPETHSFKEFFQQFLGVNKSVFENTKQSSVIEERKNAAISRQVSQTQPGEKTVIINNNFNNKTDIQVQEARELQKDLTKHVSGIVQDVFGTTMKQASENFKKGAIQ